MSFLEGAQHTTILGGTQITAASGSTVNYHQATEHVNGKALSALSAAAAHTAMHDSAARHDAPRCHRNTRAKYRDNLKQWMLGSGNDYDGKRLIWLHGGAGVGKSAIMQSVIEQCTQHAVVLGSFFFFRSDPSRNYAEVLIPTLAYQLACVFPAALAVLEPIINRNPLIFKASLRTQAYELLVRPILYLFENRIIEIDDPRRRVFVIDGLDECSDSDPQKQKQKQALIINIVASVLCEYDVPISFLIASRPEPAISSAFHREARLYATFASISLDDSIDAESDIRQFVEDSFLDILDSHPLRRHINLPWPNSSSVDRLVWKSSGHFIYAATAMKFIASSDEHPEHALHVIEGLQPSRTEQPFAQLDCLYLHVLLSAKYSNEVLKILRYCHLSYFERSVAAVCYIHDIYPKDVELFLSDVQSLVSLLPNDTGEMYIKTKHASLGDFLQNQERSQTLYISRSEYHASFLKVYFHLLDNGPLGVIRRHTDADSHLHSLASALAEAIICSQDVDLVQSLIGGHSPQDIWNLCMDPAGYTSISVPLRSIASYSVYIYMLNIRNWTAKRNHDLYFHQFKMYMQLILDDLNESVQRPPQYRILMALMFSSSTPSELCIVCDLLYHFSRRFHISERCLCHFIFLIQHQNGDPSIHSLTFEALRRLPQSQLAWGAELAIGMILVLQDLVGRVDATELYYNPHKQWLRKAKPRKLTALGSPKLSSTYYSLFDRYIHSMKGYASFPGLKHWINRSIKRGPRGRRMYNQNAKCIILLKVVILYLHKSDCTSQTANLARRLLPKAALWHPKLMRRARAELDAYVLRWEESLDGFLEKAQSLSINAVD